MLNFSFTFDPFTCDIVVGSSSVEPGNHDLIPLTLWLQQTLVSLSFVGIRLQGQSFKITCTTD